MGCCKVVAGVLEGRFGVAVRFCSRSLHSRSAVVAI